MTDKKHVILTVPVTIGNAQVSALSVDGTFRVGWLRGAPKTPGWLIAAVKSVLADIPSEASSEGFDASKLLETVNIPVPSGEEVSDMIPWLLHIAGKATGQANEVIDQLSPVDLLQILMKLMPGAVALPNFTATPASGSATSPGSSDGALKK